jgi:hypothetical protein
LRVTGVAPNTELARPAAVDATFAPRSNAERGTSTTSACLSDSARRRNAGIAARIPGGRYGTPRKCAITFQA